MLPHFHYCSMIWHFCNSEDSVKLDTLNRRILRFVLKDWDSNYDDLLDKAGVCGLANRRIQNMMICIFNCLHLGKYPCYLKQLIKLRSTAYSLRGTNILSLPKPFTTTYGLNSLAIHLSSTGTPSLTTLERLQIIVNLSANCQCTVSVNITLILHYIIILMIIMLLYNELFFSLFSLVLDVTFKISNQDRRYQLVSYTEIRE